MTTGRGAECGRAERGGGGGGGGGGGLFVCSRGVLSTRRLKNYKCSVAREREVLLVRATVVVVALLAAGEWSGARALAVVRAREGGGSIHGDILFSHSRSSRRVSV